MRQTYKRNQHGRHDPVLLDRMFRTMMAERRLSGRAPATEVEVSEGTIPDALADAEACTVPELGAQAVSWHSRVGPHDHVHDRLTAVPVHDPGIRGWRCSPEARPALTAELLATTARRGRAAPARSAGRDRPGRTGRCADTAAACGARKLGHAP
jgi:hypothetical protein